MKEEENYSNPNSEETNLKIRNLEEKQKILKERMLLIGKNLIEMRERMQETMLEMKKELEEHKQKLERMTSFVENISGEFSKFAKKDDLKILIKQAKIFQPLEYLKEQKK